MGGTCPFLLSLFGSRHPFAVRLFPLQPVGRPFCSDRARISATTRRSISFRFSGSRSTQESNRQNVTPPDAVPFRPQILPWRLKRKPVKKRAVSALTVLLVRHPPAPYAFACSSYESAADASGRRIISRDGMHINKGGLALSGPARLPGAVYRRL